jgi:hypothetical protein
MEHLPDWAKKGFEKIKWCEWDKYSFLDFLQLAAKAEDSAYANCIASGFYAEWLELDQIDIHEHDTDRSGVTNGYKLVQIRFFSDEVK